MRKPSISAAGLSLLVMWHCAFAHAATGYTGEHTAGQAVEQASCGATLQAIEPGDPAFDRLDRIYRRSLHFGGTAHRLLPHFHAEYDDIVAARSQMTEQDLPFVVHALARVEKADARQTVAIGVLGRFGTAALPCIDAALQDPHIAGRFVLNRIKIGIEAAQAFPATKR